jgi:hypothetical protein
MLSQTRDIRRILILLVMALLAGYASLASAGDPPPAPPLIPPDFQWTGRYIVEDIGADVSFSWQGEGGNLQMTAGSLADDIYFTNVLYDDDLYTLTYKWPRTVRTRRDIKCVCLGTLKLDDLNACLSTSRYVDSEILLDNPVPVNHMRVSVVLGDSKLKRNPVRLPIMEGDFYVDPTNPSKFFKVLHFGLQNVLDPALDEWIVLQNFNYTPGQVTLPEECENVKCPSDPVFGKGFFCK